VGLSQTFDRVVALPPAYVVSRIDPKVGELVADLEAFESGLPIHADGGQRNSRETMRDEALGALVDSEFFTKLAEQREERRARMREALNRLRTDWAQEEEDAGLERWRSTHSNFAPVQAGGLSFSAGTAGNTQQIPGRKMIATLAQMIGA